jgi:hypothetical protein
VSAAGSRSPSYVAMSTRLSTTVRTATPGSPGRVPLLVLGRYGVLLGLVAVGARPTAPVRHVRRESHGNRDFSLCAAATSAHQG